MRTRMQACLGLATAAFLLLGGCPTPGTDSKDAAGADASGLCGNGLVEPGEQCDDGNDDPNDGCCPNCLLCELCTASAWAGCNVGDSVCCPDDEDRPTSCASRLDDPEEARCLLPCQSASDCHWSNECGADFDDHCYSVRCGPSVDNGTAVNTPCTVAGAPGWCYPMGDATEQRGLCIEAGSLPTGATCERGFYLDATPRSVETCGGYCLSYASERTPICVPFCDPIAAYDATPVGANPCPAGFNCLNHSYISSADHLRDSDRGLCVPTPEYDPDGRFACDLLTGELIMDHARACRDATPMMHCRLWRSGSLMGTCQTATATPLGVGEACDAEADDEPCAEGSRCRPIDPFGSGDATDYACLAFCDARDAWTCDGTGLECTSLSQGSEDASPTPLGLCAPPPPPPADE